MTHITAPWLSDPDLQTVFSVFAGHGFQIYAVGGCVRNTLLGCDVTDIDMSTDATPQDMLRIAQGEGWKAVPTGIDHGTITMVFAGQAFEITTFRRDVETDGRHAQVQFSKDMVEDAQRRDFTINAMYVDAAGKLYDPVNGQAALHPTRIVFIGDAEQRIKEDYLRILRFFRFFAQYGDPDEGLDADGLAACALHSDGLAHISKERIGQEIIKLLGAPDPSFAVGAMGQSGVLWQILPGAFPLTLSILTSFENAPVDPVVRLAAFYDGDVMADLRLSKSDAKRVHALRLAAEGTDSPRALGYRLGARDGFAATLLRAAFLQSLPEDDAQSLAAKGAEAQFPLTAKDLMPDLQGPALGAAIKAAEDYWIKNDFVPNQAQLKQWVSHHDF
ncbi:MAG: CCA tRNA nucleotidyltransferase [Planktomarina sp.]